MSNIIVINGLPVAPDAKAQKLQEFMKSKLFAPVRLEPLLAFAPACTAQLAHVRSYAAVSERGRRRYLHAHQ